MREFRNVHGLLASVHTKETLPVLQIGLHFLSSLVLFRERRVSVTQPISLHGTYIARLVLVVYVPPHL